MGALHLPNIGGELDADITDVGTEMSSPALAALPDIASPDFAWLCVDPDGIAGAPEWWKITAHVAAAETATVERALEGSTARAHKAGIEWVHTLAPSELDNTGITVSDTAPTSPEDGDLWLDTDETDITGGLSYTAYTPTLSGAGWALGNGTMTARYMRIGSLVHAYVAVVFGSTSTYGADVPTWTAPLPAKTGVMFPVHVLAIDATDSTRHGGTGDLQGSTMVPVFSRPDVAGQIYMTSTTPITWATGDKITLSCTYEVA